MSDETEKEPRAEAVDTDDVKDIDDAKALVIRSKKGVEEALQSGEVPKLYASGFVLGQTNADMSIFLQNHGKVVGIVSMSFTLAKTMAQLVGNQILELETKLDHPIPTTQDIDQAK